MPDNLDLTVDELSSQVFQLWVQPELERRALTLTPSQLTKVLVEFPPQGPPVVSLNGDAVLLAEVTATRAIKAGEEVTHADFDDVNSLLPHSIHEDSGWICYAVVGGHRVVSFDFRYNRGRAKALLRTAKQFLAAATLCGEKLPAPCIDLAYSAAELSVQAAMLTHSLESKGHEERLEWLADWVKKENAPSSHHHMLADLRAQRARARYSGELRIKPGRISRILAGVSDMIDYAHIQIGDRRENPAVPNS